MIAYICPPKSERPLDFRQPYEKSNRMYVERINLAYALGGVADPIRQSWQFGPGQRHAMRVAHMGIPLTGRTPEVLGGWQDIFLPFGAKFQYAQNIDTPDIGAGQGGMLPWLEKTNVRKPRSMTFSRLMDILTGQN